MNIEHEFSLKMSDISVLFPSLSIGDFIDGITASYDGVSYPCLSDQHKDGFEAFSEGYLKFFGDELKISEIRRVHGSKVSFVGKNDNGDVVSILSLLFIVTGKQG